MEVLAARPVTEVLAARLVAEVLAERLVAGVLVGGGFLAKTRLFLGKRLLWRS